ncbi:hypothetical protein GGR56DRAFT_502725 [Xylariaceae sp. FL0804]|nr:hypothetical protein GGR56DRAFT_502725 [Xylariaceae sp. FL0804]
MRFETPAMVDVAGTSVKPASPPETPTTAFRNSSPAPAVSVHLPPAPPAHRKQQRSRTQPKRGMHDGYSHGPHLGDVSPRSSYSSEGEASDSTNSSPQSPPSDVPEPYKRIGSQFQASIAATTIQIEQAKFVIEELSDDSWDSDSGALPIQPSGFEYPESDRSRSRSRPPPTEIDPAVMAGVENLNPFFEGSDGDLDEDDEFARSLRQLQQERRIRRMTSGSITKRTASERGSDSDKEDLLPYVYEGAEGSGGGGGGLSSTRRLRRKVGDRNSIQLTGPLPDTIQELREEDEIILDDAELFARELPYWTLMDVDSDE